MSAEGTTPAELQPKTQTALDGPDKPPGGLAVGTAFPSDEIEELGERIVALSKERASRLEQYLSGRICRLER